jgi:glycosyltransferase involved in cell wall biosynthesis
VPEIAPHVHAARVYVVPLRDGAGIRGKILEAWALGRAVVTTGIGAAGLHATDGVHLLIADRADGFAAAVVRLLRDDALRRRLVSAALRRVDAEYSWEVKAREHERLWSELLEASGSPYGASPWRLAPRDVACRA